MRERFAAAQREGRNAEAAALFEEWGRGWLETLLDLPLGDALLVHYSISWRAFAAGAVMVGADGTPLERAIFEKGEVIFLRAESGLDLEGCLQREPIRELEVLWTGPWRPTRSLPRLDRFRLFLRPGEDPDLTALAADPAPPWLELGTRSGLLPEPLPAGILPQLAPWGRTVRHLSLIQPTLPVDLREWTALERLEVFGYDLRHPVGEVPAGVSLDLGGFVTDE